MGNSLKEATRVVVIGMGEMGRGMANQLRIGVDYEVTGVRRGAALDVLGDQDITLIAMRPQQWSEVDVQTGRRASEQIAEHVNERGIFVWIMAGITTRRIRDDLGDKNVALVRAMLTFTVDGYSEAGLFAEKGSLTAEQKAQTEAFFAQFGRYTWLDSEDRFPTFTLFTASMIGLLAETMEAYRAEAVAAGYSEAQSEEMLAGALRSLAHMIELGYSLEQARDKIMTRGGMTEVAVGALRRGGKQRKLARAATKAGVGHSRKLAKG